MTLVLSHRQLSNGSKLLLFVLVMMLASCSGSRKVVKRTDDRVKVIPKNNDELTDVDKSVPKVDTISWVDTSEDDLAIEVPEGEATGRSVEPGKHYNVALVLPISSHYGNGIDKSNEEFVQYYAGAKLAQQKLEEEGVNLDVHVIDQNKTEDSISLNRNDIDVIIGPYATSADKVKLLNTLSYGSDHKVPVVSPWYSNSRLVESNPYYVQMKPNLREHFVKITDHVSRNFSSHEVVLLGRDRKLDHAWFDYFQSTYRALTGSNIDSFNTIYVNEDDLYDPEYDEPFFEDLVLEGKRVFIVPNYSFSDEEYLYTVLNRLSTDRLGESIIVYGMPIMMESNRINFDYYSALNMRLVVSEFVDTEDHEVSDFTRSFFEDYGTIPMKEAYQGHDILLFLGRSLNRFGRGFLKNTFDVSEQYLQTSYRLQAVHDDDDFEKIKFVENKHLDIIQFSRGKFRRL